MARFLPGKDYVRVGRIVGAFGLRGQVKLELLTDFVGRFEKGKTYLVNGNEMELEGLSWHKERLLLKFVGVDTIDQAEALQWAYVEAHADELPPLEEDEYLTADLIGMMVVTRGGRELGPVSEVLALPAQDVLVVGEIMIPAVKQFVKSVDLQSRRIEVELIEGMEEV